MKLEPNITYCISKDEIPEVIQRLPDNNYYFRRPYDLQQHMIPVVSLKRYLSTWLSKEKIRVKLVGNYKNYQSIELTTKHANTEVNLLAELKKHTRQTIRCE